MNEDSLLALAEEIEDPVVDRPGIRRRREWASRLRQSLVLGEPEFPTDHPTTCWCDGRGWRDFGYGPVVCDMNTVILREARVVPDCPACQMGGGSEPCYNHRMFA